MELLSEEIINLSIKERNVKDKNYLISKESRNLLIVYDQE